MRLPDPRAAGLLALRAPWRWLVPLAVLQWGLTAALARSVAHDGWLFPRATSQVAEYANAVLVAHGHFPAQPTGFVWPLLLVPATWIFGSSLASALPAIVLVQVIVLQPLSLLAVYGIASRVAGRAAGYLAGAVWVLSPYVAIPFFDPRYHGRWSAVFLPQALGLTAAVAYPAMVAVLCSALLCVRAWQTGSLPDALLAGAAAGLAAGVAPADLVFLPAPLLAFALWRRWRALAALALGAAPLLLALALWRWRGPGAIDTGWAASHGFGRFWENKDQIREFFWSVRVVELLAVAGILGVARRSLGAAALLGGWFLAYVLFVGTSTAADVPAGTFFPAVLPAAPAYAVLIASIPALLPEVGPRLADRFPQAVRALPRARLALALAAAASLALVVAVLLPAGVSAAR